MWEFLVISTRQYLVAPWSADSRAIIIKKSVLVWDFLAISTRQYLVAPWSADSGAIISKKLHDVTLPTYEGGTRRNVSLSTEDTTLS